MSFEHIAFFLCSEQKTFRIEQRQAPAAVFNADAFFLRVFFLHYGILGAEVQHAAADIQPYADGAVLAGRGAVFAGIFHKSDQNHGRNLNGFVVESIAPVYVRVVIVAHALQIKIMVDVFDLLRHINQVVRGVCTYIAAGW